MQFNGTQFLGICLYLILNSDINSLQCIQDVSKECVELRQRCSKLQKDLTVSNETNEILHTEMNKLDAELVLASMKCMLNAHSVDTRSCKRNTAPKRKLQGKILPV